MLYVVQTSHDNLQLKEEEGGGEVEINQDRSPTPPVLVVARSRFYLSFLPLLYSSSLYLLYPSVVDLPPPR